MRVIAGELGGRRLHAPRGRAVRPTTDRIREALFSILGDVGGLSVLDLFAGSGALAIEALSRGSRTATLVDVDPGPARRNVAELGLKERAEVLGGDALAYLARPGGRFDLVFCDPPYDPPDKLARRLGRRLDTLLVPRLNEGARVIVESASAAPPALSLPLLDERRYGTTTLRIHAAPSGEGAR